MGGRPGDPPMTDEQRAMEYLKKMYGGMYADAGQGAASEQRRVKRADPMGVSFLALCLTSRVTDTSEDITMNT
jgi:hypothetical protein